MHIQTAALKPLESVTLSAEEKAILIWIRNASWQIVADAKEPKPYKAKVPEYYKGTRLYRMQAVSSGNASVGGLDMLIRKLSISGIISKQGPYPVSGHGSEPRFLTLPKTDLDNLGVGKDDEDED